jgi:DNA mismatch endonuclease (patch repair protein)
MSDILAKGGFSYEMYPRIPGNPDFLVGGKVIVFCDGSFWHGRNWAKLRKRLEKGNNPAYWVKHILKNRRRDREVSRKFSKLGYPVVRLWDEEVFKNPELCLDRIRLAQAK